MSSQESPSGDDAATSNVLEVRGAGFREAPVPRDSLGFQPYVEAVGEFLLDPGTKPPLTLSVEGEWGSGKSSFMLQVKSLIDSRIASGALPRYRTITFNAWHHNKSDSLWASFALAFIRGLTESMPLHRRVRAWIILQRQRVDWNAGFWPIAKLVLFVVAAVGFATWGFFHFDNIHDGAKAGIDRISKGNRSSLALAAALAASVATVLGNAVQHAKTLLGNPFTKDLTKIAASPDYSGHVAFLEKFTRDFSKILKAYVGDQGRVFVFVDDLDRCEFPRAVELTAALNMLTSAAGENLVFVLGLDRDIIAAGLAATYDKIIPFLDRQRGGTSKPQDSDFGYAFLEKFIQIPFKVPVPSEESIKDWLRRSNVESEDAGTEQDSATSGGEQPLRGIEVKCSVDSEQFLAAVSDLAPAFQYNPRRIKMLLNILRLQTIIAYETGLLGELGFSDLALFTAIVVRWPRIIPDIYANPALLDEIGKSVESSQATYWRGKVSDTLAERLKTSNLNAAMVEKLIAVLPRQHRARADGSRTDSNEAGPGAAPSAPPPGGSSGGERDFERDYGSSTQAPPDEDYSKEKAYKAA